MFKAVHTVKTFFAFAILALAIHGPAATAQDWIRTGTGLGVEKVRLAVPDFKAAGADPQTGPLGMVFNQTLWSDLDNAGLFDMVSKSFYPLSVPGSPNEMQLGAWGNPPPNAAMVAFGNLGIAGGKLDVQGWLFDAKNSTSPQVLGKQYQEDASIPNARLIAHRFADEIILRLGGGLPGVAETKIYFVRRAGGQKEIWGMDYDGAGQSQITHLGSLALSPHISPDNSRLAFSALTKDSWQIRLYSLDLGRVVAFPRLGGDNFSPAWSSDGGKLALASSMGTGHSEIFIAGADGADPKRLTAFKGADVSPVWNPKTNAQIAWVSGRSGLPQIYIMDADGSNVQRITNEGYAISPSWSPNGLLLAFSWIRHYGPGAPGGEDIYVMDIASRQFVQLTHDAGRNDFPCWSPDGRHIVFQSTRAGQEQIWTMLADGTRQQQLTHEGKNSEPNWSYK